MVLLGRKSGVTVNTVLQKIVFFLTEYCSPPHHLTVPVGSHRKSTTNFLPYRFMNPVTKLYASLRAYEQTRHFTANTGGTCSASESETGVSYYTADEILTKLGARLLDPLTDEQWSDLVNKIQTHFCGKNERLGVHPRLKEILGVLSEGTSYQWRYEQRFTDPKAVVTIPDFPLYWNEVKLSHLEAKGVGNNKLRHSIQQAEGYLVANILDQIELIGGLNSTASVSALCLGSTGVRLALSRMTADGQTGILVIERTARQGLQLWTERGHPRSETPGVRVLRSLMAAQPSAWLKSAVPPSIRLTGGVLATTQAVLGRGAFCVAFQCRNNDNGDVFVVKRRLVTTVGERSDPLHQLRREHAALAAFAADPAARRLLPTLYQHAPPVSEQSPYLASVPLGQPLQFLRNTLSTADRCQLVPQLYSDLAAALSAAHALQFCHTDVRPVNVVRAGSRFVLIDWGLARRPFDPMHRYSTNHHYFAARLLAAKSAVTQMAYDPAFDLEAAKYVALAFHDGAPRLIPDAWDEITIPALIRTRRAMLDRLVQAKRVLLAAAAPSPAEYDGIDLGCEHHLGAVEVAGEGEDDALGEDQDEAGEDDREEGEDADLET